MVPFKRHLLGIWRMENGALELADVRVTGPPSFEILPAISWTLLSAGYAVTYRSGCLDVLARLGGIATRFELWTAPRSRI